MARKNVKLYIYGAEILFAIGITIGSNGIHFENLHEWAANIARYVVYFMTIKASHEICVLGNNFVQNQSKPDIQKMLRECKQYLMIYAACILYILFYSKQRILEEQFIFLFIAYLISKYPEMEQNTSVITYGVGMACSFFEGYLTHIIPNDGGIFVGFEENINKYEAQQTVVFPVKRLFIVITKSLYCPPDLKEFNKTNKDVPYLEACQVSSEQSLEDVEKDVAGVKRRSYRNSAYKIHRRGASPVYLAAECATPLHTLYRALQRRALYGELAQVNPQEIVDDFCTMLRSILRNSPDCKNKCELVYYDDTDPDQNLADVLLDKIRDLEPDFENIIARRQALN